MCCASTPRLGVVVVVRNSKVGWGWGMLGMDFLPGALLRAPPQVLPLDLDHVLSIFSGDKRNCSDCRTTSTCYYQCLRISWPRHLTLPATTPCDRASSFWWVIWLVTLTPITPRSNPLLHSWSRLSPPLLKRSVNRCRVGMMRMYWIYFFSLVDSRWFMKNSLTIQHLHPFFPNEF